MEPKVGYIIEAFFGKDLLFTGRIISIDQDVVSIKWSDNTIYTYDLTTFNPFPGNWKYTRESIFNHMVDEYYEQNKS